MWFLGIELRGLLYLVASAFTAEPRTLMKEHIFLGFSVALWIMNELALLM